MGGKQAGIRAVTACVRCQFVTSSGSEGGRAGARFRTARPHNIMAIAGHSASEISSQPGGL